jgi:putative membrane protein
LAATPQLLAQRPPGNSRLPTPDSQKHFLAIVSGIGIALVAVGHRAVGAALVFAGVGSMAAAAIVLLLSSPDKARAALTQGTLPLIAVVLLALGLIR